MSAMLTTLLGLALMAPEADEVWIRSHNPAYELTLPPDYMVVPNEVPARYVHPRGQEIWSHVSATFVESPTVLVQNLAGVRAEEALPCVPFPPDAKWTFAPLHWNDFDIASFEYRAVVKNLPIFGLVAVLPLKTGTLTILVYSPETLEADCRSDFKQILARITRAPTDWHSPEYYEKIRLMNRIGMIGTGMLLLYPIAWAAFFRDKPLRAHWLRVAWLAAVAVLLFIPVSSPGEASLTNNLLVNGILPVILLLFAARRVKLGIEMG